MLKIDNLTVQFGSFTAVQQASFSLAAGQRFALVGESGSGKTVTALSILRLLQGANVSGQIEFDGKNLAQLSPDELRRVRGKDIAMIFQEPMLALNPLMTIGAQICESFVLHEGLNLKQAKSRALEWLEKVGMGEVERRFNSYPHQLSGGQRQRAMIAMVLACHPKLLIADEPTTALDVSLRGQIMGLITELQSQMNMAVLLITHDLNLVRQFAQTVGVMEHGKLVECADTVTLFSAPQHAYTQRLLASKPTRMAAPHQTSVEIVTAKNVRVAYSIQSGWFKKRSFFAVDDISFNLQAGETLGVVGESGSGKSTLALALLGLHPAHSGSLKIMETDLIPLPAQTHLRGLRKNLQVVFQDPFSALSPRMTVGEIVLEGLRLHAPQLSDNALQAKLDEALHEVGLSNDVAERYPHEFSGGQRQRIAIARALIMQPKILVLDEPTSALDVSIQKQILQLLVELQRKYNMAFVLISHDLEVIGAMAHRVLVMKAGRVVEQGRVEDVLQAPQHEYTKALMRAVE